MARNPMSALVCSLAGLAALCLGPIAAADDVMIREIRVQGSSILPQREIERLVYPFLGPDGGAERVVQAAEALQARYRELGYPTVAVLVPQNVEQQLTRGLATLEVYEQRVDQVRVTGARYFRQRQIENSMDSLRPGTVLNANEMQADLDRLARRSADRRIRPIIRAGDEVGGLDVELRVQDELPLHAEVELNNFASANTTDLRLSATVTYGNLFQRQAGLSLFYQTSPEDRDDVEVVSATYVHRPMGSNRVLTLTGVKTDSSVASVGGTTVLGSGEFLIGRAIVPLRSEGGSSDSMVLGFDFKNSEDITAFRRNLTDDVVRDEKDVNKLEYLSLMAGYNLTHELWGGRQSYALSAHVGVRGLFNERDEFEEKRFKGEPNFLYLKYALERRQPLPWQSLSLKTGIKGQLTGDQLIGNEQLSVGGFRTVRGYLESERLADYGGAATVEINWDVAELFDWGSVAVQPYAFWDWGMGVLNEPLPDEDQRFNLASAGIGLRLGGRYGLEAEAAWAHALRDSTSTKKGDDHVSFTISLGI